MPIVTLTSDLGLADPYAATVKGRMLRRCPGVQLIDVTHQVRAFETADAARALRETLPHFPDETIHWVGVEPTYPKRPRDLVAVYGSQYVVGPDDGFFSLLSDAHPDFLFAVRHGIAAEFGESGVHADSVLAASWLASGQDILAIAEQVQGIAQRTALRAPEGEDFFRANVVHIDAFGNIVLNVNRAQLEAKANGRKYAVRLRRQDRIDKIHSRYAEVDPGERLCLFNSAGNLEIAINQGNASGLLGIKRNDNVVIEFVAKDSGLERPDDGTSEEQGLFRKRMAKGAQQSAARGAVSRDDPAAASGMASGRYNGLQGGLRLDERSA
jgi:S-adenosylmethionine hydrolase